MKGENLAPYHLLQIFEPNKPFLSLLLHSTSIQRNTMQLKDIAIMLWCRFTSQFRDEIKLPRGSVIHLSREKGHVLNTSSKSSFSVCISISSFRIIKVQNIFPASCVLY